jgi:crotonobetainyl-CoA:carnitine CoA-transferase CaiB-like acyl-CoA transferase
MFKDLVVVELASVLAGPSVGMFFSELGAKVYKIENPVSKGDITRQWKLPQEDSEELSAYYQSVNWNKTSLFVDLKSDISRDGLYELIRQADIIISNYDDKQAARLGVDYLRLININPKLIFAQLYAFDQGDPRKGFDIVMQAESGFLSMTGSDDAHPARIPVALIDLIAGHQLKEAILLAMIQQATDGRAKRVEVSLFKSAIASLANQASNFLVAGHTASRIGTLHPNIAPYGDLFTTKDGFSGVLAIGSDLQFENLCSALKMDADFLKMYVKNVTRLKHRTQLMETLNQSLLLIRKESLALLFNEYKIPFGWIASIDEVFEKPLAKSMLLKNPTDAFKNSTVSSLAFKIESV